MTTTRTGDYIGRHRSPYRRPAPLPMANLDGLLDAAVTVHLGVSDPYVMLSSDHDQAVIALSEKQVQRILAGVLRGLEKPDARIDDEQDDDLGDDFDPTDADLAISYWPVTTTERHAAARDLRSAL
ncbi:MAG TPA: hypothetical protein VGF17_24560 [Phytomonospora sp.]